jgi:hypothetical protein
VVQIHSPRRSQLGIIVRTRGRLAIRKRHQSKHLDLTIPAFEAEGREFESLRARHPFNQLQKPSFLQIAPGYRVATDSVKVDHSHDSYC